MGNSYTCCGCGSEDAKKDAELDKYIKVHHIWKFPHKCPKLDKKYQAFFKGLDFEDSDKTFKCAVAHEILDDNAKKQDMQSVDSIDQDFLLELSTLTNSILGPASGPKGTQRGGSSGEDT